MTWNLVYIRLFVNRIYVTLILFALHYIQQNARSTVQTEQAMLFGIENIYRRHGAGPQEAAADMDLNVIAKNLHSRNMR